MGGLELGDQVRCEPRNAEVLFGFDCGQSGGVEPRASRSLLVRLGPFELGQLLVKVPPGVSESERGGNRDGLGVAHAIDAIDTGLHRCRIVSHERQQPVLDVFAPRLDHAEPLVLRWYFWRGGIGDRLLRRGPILGRRVPLGSKPLDLLVDPGKLGARRRQGRGGLGAGHRCGLQRRTASCSPPARSASSAASDASRSSAACLATVST